jgi:hypothetical protein
VLNVAVAGLLRTRDRAVTVLLCGTNAVIQGMLLLGTLQLAP